MMKILMFACGMLAATPVWASSQPIEVETLAPMALPLDPGKGEGRDNAPPAPLTADEDAVDAAEQARLLCETAVIMGSTPGADYRAGVDVRGRPVVPAEGYGAASPFTLPERIDIPLNIDILDTMGVSGTPAPALSARMGIISVLKGGQVLYNGQDMTRDVRDYCDNTHDTPINENPAQETTTTP